MIAVKMVFVRFFGGRVRGKEQIWGTAAYRPPMATCLVFNNTVRLILTETPYAG